MLEQEAKVAQLMVKTWSVVPLTGLKEHCSPEIGGGGGGGGGLEEVVEMAVGGGGL